MCAELTLSSSIPRNAAQYIVWSERRTRMGTSDPGKALISGKCSDVNRGKGPVLKGPAARAPYFYNERFQMNLTSEQKEYVAFLNSL